MKINIDASNLILGRLSSYAAKQALLGNKVDIVNCEKAILTGKKETTFKKIKEKRERGTPLKGPFIPRKADRFVRRTIRGMLPYKQYKGKKAFENIMCYIGIPDKLKNEKLVSLENAHISKSKNINFITMAKVQKFLGK